MGAGRKLQDFIDTSDVKKVVHDITKSTADSVMGVGSDRISAAAAGASYSSPSTVVEEQLEAGKQRYAAAQIAGRRLLIEAGPRADFNYIHGRSKGNSGSGGIVDIIHDDLKNAATELPEDLITAQVNHLAGRKLQDFIDTSDVKKVVHDITKSTADSVMGVGSDRISAAAAGASYSSPSTVVEEQLEAGKQRYAAAQIAGRRLLIEAGPR